MPPIVLDHIAIGARQLTDAPGFLVGELGGVPTYGGPTGDYVFWTWEYPGGGVWKCWSQRGRPEASCIASSSATGPASITSRSM